MNEPANNDEMNASDVNKVLKDSPWFQPTSIVMPNDGDSYTYEENHFKEPDPLDVTFTTIGTAVEPTNFEKVVDFHHVMSQPVLETPQVPTADRVKLRVVLILEEVIEALAEVANGSIMKSVIHVLREELTKIKNADLDEFEFVNLNNFAKELADIAYVVYGANAEFGIDADFVFSEVHDSNMTKVDEHGKVTFDENGKVIKPESYRPLNMKEVMKELKEEGYMAQTKSSSLDFVNEQQSEEKA